MELSSIGEQVFAVESITKKRVRKGGAGQSAGSQEERPETAQTRLTERLHHGAPKCSETFGETRSPVPPVPRPLHGGGATA
ncbi:chromobox protein 8-like [Clarias magur]|uniref:Chromobox protein 8-like n=1 Tax=Clarias magur TaxID=1594786 RepID=A0A8J4TEU3_CLAMG|nr:chromobox protein 8-like [Clarias magur]